MRMSEDKMNENSNMKKFLYFLLTNIVWILLFMSMIIMGIIEPVFFTSEILGNILVQATVLGVLTGGLACVLLLGEIDLSVVGIMAISATVGTMLMNNGLDWIVACLLMVLCGFIFGAINGLLVAKLKAVSLIETLAMNLTLSGMLMAITKGRSIVGFPDSFKFLGQGNLAGLPLLPIVLFIVYIILYLVWTNTGFGRSLFAVGGNVKTSYVSGINIDRVKISAFIISGTLAGLSGYLLSSYMGAVTTTFGKVYQMDTIAAAVIGGVSLSGGKGTISGVLGGVLLLTVIQVGLQILGISPYYVEMAGGLMILLAVLIDAIRQKYLG